MANELKAKVIFKHKHEVEWENSKYVPQDGEMIIYDAEVDNEGNPIAEAKIAGTNFYPKGRTTPFIYARVKYGNGKSLAEELPFSSNDTSDYDLVIDSENIFKKDCVYALHRTRTISDDGIVEYGDFDKTTKQKEPEDGFNAKRVLVKNINFVDQLGTGDVDLFIFRSSIDYIRFENCTWQCQWRVSGARPEILSKTGSEYERAPGKLKLVLDGIQITEEAVVEAKNKADTDGTTRYYIGLRNIGRIQNCWINYPQDYQLSKYGSSYKESFKMNLQYFENAQDCKLTAFWAGENVSDCRVAEQIKYCKNVCNIVAEPMYEPDGSGGTKVLPVEINSCNNVANIYGEDVKYISCKGIAVVREDLAPVKEEVKAYSDENLKKAKSYSETYLLDKSEFDLIVTSKEEFLNIQTLDDPKIKSVLVTDFSVGSGNGIFSDLNYVDTFKIPVCVKYIKFAKGFQVTGQNIVIQGHPSCVIDGFPTATPNYEYRQCSALLDFKEVINSKNSNYFANTNELEAGISNKLIVGGEDLLGEAGSLYNFTGTKFTNCSIAYIDGAANITSCELTASKSGNIKIANVKNINNLLVKRNVPIDSCSNLSNISKVSDSIKITYTNCTNVDYNTCDGFAAPTTLAGYGITDAYTTSEVQGYVTDFVNGELEVSAFYDDTLKEQAWKVGIKGQDHEAFIEVGVDSGAMNFIRKPAEGEDSRPTIQEPIKKEFAFKGDNISEFVNDANYIAKGANVTDLANDANYISVDEDVSSLFNDAKYVTSSGEYAPYQIEVVQTTPDQPSQNVIYFVLEA